MKVFILTYAPSMERLYGNTLIFKTLRLGFPTAEIFVYDNCSDMSCYIEIERLATDNNCTPFRFNTPMEHYDFINMMIAQNKGTIIFLDPDIVFWRSFENFKPTLLLSGRRIPLFYDAYTGCLTASRLHTSFLWVSDCQKFMDEFDSIRESKFEFNPFQPIMFKTNKWFRFDTLSQFYNAVPEKCSCFREYLLNGYDHLFCGTHLESVIESIPEPYKSHWIEWHEAAKESKLSKLKGIWRVQQQFFESMKMT